MDIPAIAYPAAVAEGKMFFFKSDCPIGVPDHIHICVKRNDKIFLFATGSSQVEKALKRVEYLRQDVKTYPVFKQDETNKLNKPQTYVDCNNPIEVEHLQFCELLKQDKIYELPGCFDQDSMARILEGIRCSTLVPQRIKNLL